MTATTAFTKYPSGRAQGKKKLLLLAPRTLFSSYQRRSELKHFASLCAAWKKLVNSGRSSVDFTILSAKHPLEEMIGLPLMQKNAFLSEVTGFEVESAELSSLAGISNSLQDAGATAGLKVASKARKDAEVAVNFVESIGFEKEELASFLQENARDFEIAPAGWHNFPSTRGIVCDSYALACAGGKLIENGKFAGVLAVGWQVFDAALRLAKDYALPSFHNFSTPSKLEAEVEGVAPVDAVISRELAAIKHGNGILSFDVAGLQWILKNYAPQQLSGAKANDFENVIEVLELLSDSAGLMKIVSASHAHPHDRRRAIALLKDVGGTLDSHSVLHGQHFVSSKYCAAFNSPLQASDCSKAEIFSARRSVNALASFDGASLSKARPKKVFSLVFADASDAMLKAFSKALSLMPEAAFIVRSDSPKLAGRLKQISGGELVSHRIAPMPQNGERAVMAASHAIVFPSPVSSLLHYENALSAVHSARKAGVSAPAIVATSAAPFFIKGDAILPPAPSHEQLQSVLSRVSESDELGLGQGNGTERVQAWSWNDAALKMAEFLSSRL